MNSLTQSTRQPTNRTLLNTFVLGAVLTSLASVVVFAPSRAAADDVRSGRRVGPTLTRSSPSTTASGPSGPAGQTATPPGPQPVSVANNGFWKGFGVGFVGGYVDYKEPGFMREYGQLYGLNASVVSLNELTSVIYNFEGEIVFGRILYDGAVKNLKTGVVTPVTAGASDYILNLRGTVGYRSQLNSVVSMSPDIGLGYRVLNDKIDGSGSYNRNVTYLYLPVGGQMNARLGRTNTFSLSADFDLVLLGTVISKFSDIDSSAPDITNHNSGFGYRVTAALHHQFDGWAGHLQPFYQKWKMNKSDEVRLTTTDDNGNPNGVLTLAEPQNESDFVGLNIGADF